METVISDFKKSREGFDNVRALPIDSERAKFEITDRTIKGYAIVWGSKNDYNEIVVKGACARSIEARGVNGAGKNKIVVLNQHRQWEPIGMVTRLEEDEYGLYFEAEITAASYAEDALINIRAGVLNQLSYGFNYIWDKVDYDADAEAFILREIKLYEISVVTFSSDENAQLRSFSDYQKIAGLDTFTPAQLNELKTLLSLRTSETRDEHSQQEKKEAIINKPTFF